MGSFQGKERYPELGPVEEAWRAIRAEALGALEHLTFMADDRVRGPRSWGVLPLLPEAEDLEVIPAELRERCRRLAPRTVGIMSALPAVRAYAFSVLAPRDRIAAHRHQNPCVTALLTLQARDAFLTVAGERAPLREGETLVFDYRLLHATDNQGDIERVALLMLLDDRA